MKLIRHLSLFIILISAASEGFAQKDINQLLQDLSRFSPTTEEINQALRDTQKQINASKERQQKAFNPWVLEYYSHELKVAGDQITDEHFDRFVKKLEQDGATKEEISRALDKEGGNLADQAGLEILNELKGWFRRDFPNTPWGQLPQ